MYATIYLDKEPTEKEAGAFYSEPVRVPNGDGSFHWEALILRADYDAAKLTGKEPKVFSTCAKAMLKPDGKPRHVFGSPGAVHDPEAIEETIETPTGDPHAK